METKITLEKWVEFQLQESNTREALLQSRQKQKRDGISGLKSRFLEFAKDIDRGNTELRGIAVSGKKGSGKHGAAVQLVRFWYDSGTEIKALFLSGSELADQAENFYEISMRLDALLKACLEEDAEGICLFLEEPEECGYGKRLYLRLANLLYQYGQEDSPAQLLLILISEEPIALPVELAEQLLPCRADLPRAEHRDKFLSMQLTAESFSMSESFRTLVDLTEGFDYGTLGCLAAELNCQPEEELLREDFLRQEVELFRAPPPEREQIEVILKGLEGLQLPVQQTASLPREYAPAKETQPQPQDVGTSNRAARIQQMIDGSDEVPFSQKMLDLIGEAGIKELEAVTEFARNDSSYMPVKPKIERTTELVF